LGETSKTGQHKTNHLHPGRHTREVSGNWLEE